jgi:hypothetical protein
VRTDIKRAARISTLLSEHVMTAPCPTVHPYGAASQLVGKIEAGCVATQGVHGVVDEHHTAVVSPVLSPPTSPGEEDDGRLRWFSTWFKDKPALEDSIFPS